MFLGPPGVGKGTYASRVAKHLGVAHIAAGDLVRAEMKSGSAVGESMKATVDRGELLPDELVLELVNKRLQDDRARGEMGFILDGFPRTAAQAEALEVVAPISFALNLSLREDVLVEKCLGRRLCSKCGKNWNVANIYRAAGAGTPEIVMPPLNPPDECQGFMTVRSDDTEEVVRNRLSVYQAQAGPVEDFYSARGLLVQFPVTGGIPETMPRLLDVLAKYSRGGEKTTA